MEQINLSKLPKTVHKQSKRVGRGYGSGRGGHTSGRGAKGDKARGKASPFFEGTKTKKSLMKRLPLLRGKARFRPRSKSVVLSLGHLAGFKAGDRVSEITLMEKGIINNKRLPVKILSGGELKTALTVAIPCSGMAKKKIIEAGGQVITAEETAEVAKSQPKSSQVKIKDNQAK